MQFSGEFMTHVNQIPNHIIKTFLFLFCRLFHSRRRDRLQSVRSTFYQCYCKAIGFKYKNGTELSSLGSMLGNIAERVGFSQRTQM